jgi:iron complex outermembrane recepter protein
MKGHTQVRGVGRLAALMCTASLTTGGWAAPALAQETTAPPAAAQAPTTNSNNNEILVLARKRQESILKVPVVVTAVSAETLQTSGVTEITDLPKLVPGLVIAGNLLSIGPQITIRGVGTSSFDPGVDQSVSLNIDGLSLGQGLAFGSAMFDVAQVEVLKGPQALFYGKSSPGGVIALRTADPGNEPEFIFRVGYEFVSREVRPEFIASGPLTDTLGARFAAMYSVADGYFNNRAVAEPGTGAQTPTHVRDLRPKNYAFRGTLLWEPMDNFSARFKANHVYDRATNADQKQLSNCPDGPGQAFVPFPPLAPVPFIGGDDCKYDRTTNLVYMDPAFFPNIPNRGVPYLENEQNFGTLELNWEVSDGLNLNSTTAYYDLDSSSMVNPTLTTRAGPTFAVANDFGRREFTQEFRLESDFSGPLNFTLGAFYEDGKIRDRVTFIRNRSYFWISPEFFEATTGFPLDILNDDRQTTVDIETYSLFGQLRYKLTDQLELAGGVRWTDETRSQQVFDFQNNVDLTPTLPVTKIGGDNFSPEATITYTPTDDLTLFASYKKGYKSGSFKMAVPPVAGEDNSFDDERVEGFEGGLKSRLFDRSLLMNISVYNYLYKGLQVGGIANSEGGVPVITTVNAGKARTYGVDFDLSYSPPTIEGLRLNASLNWNKAEYKNLDNIPCYANQTFAQGCNTFFAPPSGAQLGLPPGVGVTVGGVYGFYNGQDLSGTQMIRAPEWAANFGFDYELPVGNGMKLQLANNNQYSSSYPSYLANGRPDDDNIQDDFFRINATLALKGENDSWEIALIGQNLTDKLVASNCSAPNAAGGIFLPFNGAYTGGSVQGPMGWAEALCFPDGGGRSVWLRLTMRPSSF